MRKGRIVLIITGWRSTLEMCSYKFLIPHSGTHSLLDVTDQSVNYYQTIKTCYDTLLSSPSYIMELLAGQRTAVE